MLHLVCSSPLHHTFFLCFLKFQLLIPPDVPVSPIVRSQFVDFRQKEFVLHFKVDVLAVQNAFDSFVVASCVGVGRHVMLVVATVSTAADGTGWTLASGEGERGNAFSGLLGGRTGIVVGKI